MQDSRSLRISVLGVAILVAFLSLVIAVARAQPFTDASMDVIVSGPTRTASGDKSLVAKVSNVGVDSSITVCDTDISWDITVNGAPTTGSVSEPAACTTLKPGASARFKATWTFGVGEVSAGATIAYTATISVTGDLNTGNDSDTELRVAK